MVAPAVRSILDQDEIVVPSINRDTSNIQQPQFETRSQQQLDPIQLERPAILNQLEATAQELLTGEIPQDVLDRVEQASAERGIQGGFGLSQASEFLTATNFGLTSLDMMDRGAELGLSVANLQQAGDLAIAEMNTNRQQFNETLNFNFTELQNQQSQWNDQMVSILSDVRTDEQAANLALLELASINTRFIQGQTAQMLIANSNEQISNLQQNVDAMAQTLGLSNAHVYAILGLDPPKVTLIGEQ